nr:uncharacterized protein C19orf44 homolog [Misgurnus anguillicaudatus]XP_055073892.1 uncharacterized protein C19orf44 homolog [Misgurnus anguillicaudatus]XP_055073893.1 uncharacterized protein C19orf44 homolog [Misgurnus anguillicaudatus]XP_055073894.1 uncharacterized protein C19orf44 homolog [Misgurnus anguillicaudatus]XP_055073895.1 uncharacterized protein C19orf44 homolog [Misgurnus anguillicaudatus]
MLGLGGRSSALDRAKAHLSGQRISAISKDKRNVGNNGTVVPQSKQAKFLDLSDVSSTSQSKNGDDPAQKPSENFSLGGGSRFLKKTSRDAAGDGRSSPGGPDKFELIPQRNSHSAALSKLSLIENRIRNQKGKGEGLGIQTEPQETRLSLQSSSDLSMTGGRFLKKNKTLSEHQEPLKTPHKTPLESITAASGVNERKGWRFSPDSDEQDIQRLLGDSFSLSEDIMRKPASPEPFHRTSIKTSIRPSPTSKHPPSSPKPPPSSRPDSRRLMFTERSMSSESDHSEIKSLDDLFPVAAALDSDDTVSERSAASDDFKLHVMSLDDLAPVLSEVAEISHDKVETKLKNEGVSKSTNKIIKVPSPPTPEELSAAYESDFESEIPSEEPASVSEVSEHLTDENKDVSEAQSSYKSQDEDDKLTSLSESSRSSRHRRHSDSSSQSGSSDATVTRGPSPERQMKDTAVQTQTDGLTYTWSSGMAAVGPSLGMTYVDPTPIASHTVSAEAIESVTSYSPAMLALNDMLRQQLALTRAFIDTTRRHYTSVMEALGTGDYKYTTLEDTKEFIRTHRPPKLSMEEALEEVLQEMRDYHYI